METWERSTTRGSLLSASRPSAAGDDRPPSEGAGHRDTSAAGAHSGHHAGRHGVGAAGVASTARQEPVSKPAAGGAATRAVSIEHGLALAASALLAGLAPFAILVWLPASRQSGVGRAVIRSFGVLAGGLILALDLTGVGELSELLLALGLFVATGFLTSLPPASSA